MAGGFTAGASTFSYSITVSSIGGIGCCATCELLAFTFEILFDLLDLRETLDQTSLVLDFVADADESSSALTKQMSQSSIESTQAFRPNLNSSFASCSSTALSIAVITFFMLIKSIILIVLLPV